MNELAKNLSCIVMRNGIEIWLEADRVAGLQEVLKNITAHKFIKFDERTINTADILGIFNAADMEDHTRRRNGQWKCDDGVWHDRNTRCSCPRQVITKVEYL